MPDSTAPIVVLVRPQLGQNIGMCARAMANCGLSALRLVAPRDGWPNPEATAAAAGADDILDTVEVFPDTAAAIADCTRVYATTARPRGQVKPVVTPRQAAAELRAAGGRDGRTAVLFGPERTGLENDEVALADAVVFAPLNPAFTSLNLAQAVLLVAHEWWMAADATPPRKLHAAGPGGALATKAELDNLLGRLEAALEQANYYLVPEKRPSARRNIRNIFARARLTKAEVETLHGVLSALIKMPKQPRRRRGGGTEV